MRSPNGAIVWLWPIPASASRQERPPAALEAALEHGSVLRLHLRTEIDGIGDDPRRWVIALEDRDAQRAQMEAQARLEAEMAGLMDSIESGVLLLDAAGNIRMVSDRLGSHHGTGSAPPVRTGNHRRADRQPGGASSAVRPKRRRAGASTCAGGTKRAGTNSN